MISEIDERPARIVRRHIKSGVVERGPRVLSASAAAAIVERLLEDWSGVFEIWVEADGDA